MGGFRCVGIRLADGAFGSRSVSDRRKPRVCDRGKRGGRFFCPFRRGAPSQPGITPPCIQTQKRSPQPRSLRRASTRSSTPGLTGTQVSDLHWVLLPEEFNGRSPKLLHLMPVVFCPRHQAFELRLNNAAGLYDYRNQRSLV